MKARFGRFLVVLSVVLGASCAGSKPKTESPQAQAQLQVELIETYLDKGLPNAALPLLRRALAEEPEDLRLRCLYGAVLRDLGLYEQAKQQFDFVLARDERFADAHAGLGVLSDLMRQHAVARKHHRRAVELAPKSAKYRNNNGFSLYLAGHYQDAIEELQAALNLEPTMMVAFNNLGFAYGAIGKYEHARRLFEQGGKHAEALLNLSLVYEQNGDDDTARALRDEAYALAPDLRAKDRFAKPASPATPTEPANESADTSTDADPAAPSGTSL